MHVGGERVTFCLVADGHGGREAAAYCCDNVINSIAEAAADGSSAALNEAAETAFFSAHLAVRLLPRCTAGCTLSVCALNMARRELSIWNVGDSLGLLVHAGGYMQLGDSHRLEYSEAEQQRCLSLGARLGRALNDEGQPEGGLRAYPGGLAVTRGIGDADCGDIVCPTPAYSTHPLPPDGGAVVLCSDGVWDHASNEDVSRILLDGRYTSAASAALSVVKRVLKTRGLMDDTTAVVILFGGEEPGEKAPAPSSGLMSFARSPRRKSRERQTSGEGDELRPSTSFLRRMSKEGPAHEMDQSMSASKTESTTLGEYEEGLIVTAESVTPGKQVSGPTQANNNNNNNSSSQGGTPGIDASPFGQRAGLYCLPSTHAQTAHSLNSSIHSESSSDSSIPPFMHPALRKDNSVRGGNAFIEENMEDLMNGTIAFSPSGSSPSTAARAAARQAREDLPTIFSRPTTADPKHRSVLNEAMNGNAPAPSPDGSPEPRAQAPFTRRPELPKQLPPVLTSPRLVVPGDHAVPEWGDSPSASPPEQRAGSFNKKRGSKLAVNTSGSPYSPAPRAADASGSTGTNGISQPDSPKLSADSGSPSFSKERRRSQLSQWTGSGRVKRQSLSTMFDSTVQKGAGILSSPASRRRSFMPAALMKKEGSGLSKNSPPQPLPWHGSPTSLAAPDSVEGLRVKAKPSPEITRRSNSRNPSHDSDEQPVSSSSYVPKDDTGSSKDERFDNSRETENNSNHSGGAWHISSGEAQPNTRVVQYSQFSNLTYLGAGEFATVHAEVLDGAPVALKILKQSKRNEAGAVKGLKREIMLMSLMAHPNVLRALALGEEHGKPFMVVEKLGRTLQSELPGDFDATPFWSRIPQCKKWPLSRALHCAIQLGSALAYCHDEAFVGYRVLHRDVKPANIGFKPDGQLVLFDFGLATLWTRDDAGSSGGAGGQAVGEAASDAPRKLTGETGSLRYMAPEVANSQPYNHKAEVFSFATVLWEMACHRRPFEGYSPDVFRSALQNGHRPVRAHHACMHTTTRKKFNARSDFSLSLSLCAYLSLSQRIPKKWDAELRALISTCWNVDQSSRPNFHQIVPRLREFQQKEERLEAKRTKLKTYLRAMYP